MIKPLSVEHRPCVLIAAEVAAQLRDYHLPWVEHLQENGVHVIGVARDATLCGACRDAFDEVFDVPFARPAESLRRLSGIREALARIIDRFAPAVVHIHTSNAAFWTRLALKDSPRRDGMKVVYASQGFRFYRGASALRNAVFRSAESYAARFTDVLLTVNEEDFRIAQGMQLRPEGFCARIPSAGVDLERFSLDAVTRRDLAAALREKLGLKWKDPVLLMLSEFEDGKRHEDLIRAVKGIREKRIELLLVGSGLGETRIRQFVADFGMEDQVSFLAHPGDVRELLAVCNAVVLPSAREGLPMGVMQAMAMGTPVIGAHVRGTRDLLEGGCGWLYEMGSVPGLISSIRSVIFRWGNVDAVVARARERVRSEYSREVVQEKLEAVYRRLGIELHRERAPLQRVAASCVPVSSGAAERSDQHA